MSKKPKINPAKNSVNLGRITSKPSSSLKPAVIKPKEKGK